MEVEGGPLGGWGEELQMSEAPEESPGFPLGFLRIGGCFWAGGGGPPPPPGSRAWGRSGGGTSRGPGDGGAGERDQLPEASVSGQDPEKQGSEVLLGVVTRQRPPVPVPQ